MVPKKSVNVLYKLQHIRNFYQYAPHALIRGSGQETCCGWFCVAQRKAGLENYHSLCHPRKLRKFLLTLVKKKILVKI